MPFIFLLLCMADKYILYIAECFQLLLSVRKRPFKLMVIVIGCWEGILIRQISAHCNFV